MRKHGALSAARARWTALVAVLAALGLGVGVLSVSVPFVVWSAGTCTDLYAAGGVVVTGADTYPVTGHLQVADVSVSSTPDVRFGDALAAFFSSDRAVLPQAVSFPVGQPISQVAIGSQSEEIRRTAEAAALNLAGLPVTRAPRVVSVAAAGPSSGELLADDVITAVGATTVTSVADFNQAVATHSIGDTIQLSVTRAGKQLDSPIDVVAEASKAAQPTPSLGVTMADSYLLGSVVVQGAPTTIGSGLMLAIALYDKVTPGGPLLGNLTVAGAGMVDANGVVSGVTGANERLRAGQAAGAQVFLLPASNCGNVAWSGVTMTVVAVTSLQQAVTSLRILSAGYSAGVPMCPQ